MGKYETYSQKTFRSSSTFRCGSISINSMSIQLHESHPFSGTVPIHNHETGNGIGQLRNEVEVSLAALRDKEGPVTGTGSGRCSPRSFFGKESGVGIDGEDAHKIRAEIGDDNVFLGRVEECFVRVWCQLSFEWIGTWTRHGEGESLERG